VSKAVKKRMMDEFRTRYESFRDCVVCSYMGTRAQEFVLIRDNLAGKGVSVSVVRNRLAARALSETGHGSATALLSGPCAIATGEDVDPVELVKAITEQTKDHEHFGVIGSVIEGQLLDEARTAAVAKIPPRDQLYAQIAGVFAAPLRQTASALASVTRAIAYALSAYRDKLQDEG